MLYTHAHTHIFKGPLPGTNRVSWYQKSKNQSGFYWNKRQWVAVASFTPYVCKSAPRSRQITMPAPHHSGFYRPDTLPATQPTASKHICSIYIHKHTNTHTRLTALFPGLPGCAGTRKVQEAQLSPRDRAMRRVNWNLANCHATVQKLLIRQVLT